MPVWNHAVRQGVGCQMLGNRSQESELTMTICDCSRLNAGNCHKKMLKMKIAPNGLLKTKGQKSAPNELMKINKLPRFLDDLLKGKEKERR